MVSSVRIVPNQREIDRLPHYSGVQADATNRAERVLEQAQATAPVLTGAYRDSLHLERDADTGGVSVASDVEYAMSIEANDGILARALDAAR